MEPYMKIMLVSPPFKGMSKYPPLGIGYIASTLMENGFPDVSLLDADIMEYSVEKTIDKIMNDDRDLVGISVCTPAVNTTLKIAERLKNLDDRLRVIVGGPHISSFPETLLSSRYIDAACIGEGEESFLELSERYKQGRDLNGVRGVLYKDKGQIIKNELRQTISDIDKIPPPARFLYKLDRYRIAGEFPPGKFPFTTLLTGRGCPFNCTFCASKTVFGRKIRFRSVDMVLKEIEDIVYRFGIRHIQIIDDTFTFKKSRVIEFCEKIKKRGLKIIWNCYARVNTVDPEILKAMKEAGCYMITYGLESGNQDILDNIKKQTTVEMGKRAITLTKKIGIKTQAGFMFGGPGETRESIKQTVKFALSLKCDHVGTSIATPYPGTELFNTFKEKIGQNIDWDLLTMQNPEDLGEVNPVVLCCDMDKEEFIAMYRWALRKLLLQPRFVFNRALRIRSFKELFWGLSSIFKITFSNIRALKG